MTFSRRDSRRAKARKHRKRILYAVCIGLAVCLAAGLWMHSTTARSDREVQIATVGNHTAEIEAMASAQAEQNTEKQMITIDALRDTEEPQTAADTQQGTEEQTTPSDAMEGEEQRSNPYGIDASKPMIALSFDDGPSQYTWDIVHTLQAHNARATFFVLGDRVATHQAAIEYTMANHNEIASHSFSHANLVKLTDAQVIEQVRSVDVVLQQQHGCTPALYRVPYGSKDERVMDILKNEGKPVIGWSVDPYDWKVRDKDTVVNHVLSRVKDGDIILMHDIYEPTAQAVAELVPALLERGYQIVTVSELLQFRGVTPEPGVYYREVPPAEVLPKEE